MANDSVPTTPLRTLALDHGTREMGYAVLGSTDLLYFGVHTLGARADQGEAVSYSLDGVNWVNVTVASTTGWQGYMPYSPIAWKRVPYGMSAWLRLNAPVQARFVRFRWDGDRDALHEVEVGFLTAGSSVPPAYPVPPPDCQTLPREHLFPVYFQELHGTDAAHLWAVGNSSGAFGFGIIRFFNGQSWQTQLPQATRRLNAVVAASASAVWAAGDSGLILATSNGGQTWLPQTTPNVQHLYDIGAASASVLWAVGANGTILKTSNGGQVWSQQTSGTTQTLASVAPLPNQEAWAVGSNGTILHTRDGGAAWLPEMSGINSFLSDVIVLSSLEAWAVGEGGRVLRTTNGGATWTSLNSGTTEWLIAIARDQVGGLWVVGAHGTILRHTGGVFQQHTSGTTARLSSIFVTSVNGAWVSSSEAENTLLQWNPAWVPAWQQRSEVVHQDHLYGMAGPFSRNEVWATGSLGAIIYSQDRGMTWRTLHVASGVTNVTLFSVVVTPQRYIWAAGFGTAANGNLEGVVVHYNGVTWQNHYTGDNHILNRVSASTARHAWAVGASRTILYTDTSGQTWTRQAIPANVPPGNFLDVLAVSETEAWVVGEDGVMLRTTNSGQTWVLQPSLTTRDLWSIAMTAPNDIWVAGASGTIFHYDGQNWTSGIGATGEHLNSISPTPFSGVWTVGVNGALLGFEGVHWFKPASGTVDNLRSVSTVGSIQGPDLWVLSTQNLGVNPAILQYSCR